MDPAEVTRAIVAATTIAAGQGLACDDATILQNANRIAARLLPCDVLVRVAPRIGRAEEVAAFEIDVARQFDEAADPLAVVETRVHPRVYLHEGFAVTFWKYYETTPGSDVAPAEYAHALERLHGSMRPVHAAAPHFTSRVAQALAILEEPARSPDLPGDDREFLINAIRTLQQTILDGGAPEQLIHGEPHPGNLLRTTTGFRFIDLETCCYGPVEFDIAHAPIEAGRLYRNADRRILRACRMLTLSLVAAWRADRNDQYANGREMRGALISAVREALTRTDVPQRSGHLAGQDVP